MLQSKDATIRTNPLIATYFRLLILYGIMFILFFLFIIFAVISIFTAKDHTISFAQFFPNSSLYITLFLIYFFSFFSNLSQQRYWKRIEQRRFTAAENKHTFPTVEQPTENSKYLHMPSILQARPGKKSIPFIIVISLIFTLLLIGLPAWFSNNFLFFSSDRLQNFVILFAIVASVMIILLLALFLSPLGTQKIIVNEQNLSIYAGGQKKTIQWNDVQLFAVYNAFGAQKSGSVLTYELSSTRDIVRWNWVQRRDPFNMRMVPTIPLDEYNQQMQALNAFIIMRTGAPLSDLRAKPTMN